MQVPAFDFLDRLAANFPERAIDLDPRWQRKWFQRAADKATHGDHHGVLSDLDEVFSREPQSAHAFWKRSRAQLELGRFTECLTDSQTAIEIKTSEVGELTDVDVADCWLVSALSQMRMAEDYRKVAKACTSAIFLNPQLNEAYVVRAQAQLKLGFYVASELDCTEALQRDPNFVAAWATRGRSRLRQKQWEGAVEDCQEALSLDGRSRLALSTLGFALLQLGDEEGALENCERAVCYLLGIDPDAKAKLKRAKPKGKSKAKASAKKSSSPSGAKGKTESGKTDSGNKGRTRSSSGGKSLSGKPKSESGKQRPDATASKEAEDETGSASAEGATAEDLEADETGEGESQRKSSPLGSPGTRTAKKAAMTTDELASAMNKYEIEELADLFAIRAQVKLAIDDNVGAIADCCEALKHDSTIAICWAARGEAKRRQNDLPGAILDCDEALKLDPATSLAYLSRAQCKLKHGIPHAVINDCSEALALDMNQVTAWATRAAARLDIGDVQGAWTDSQSTVNLDPQNLLGWCTLGGAKLDDAKDLKGSVLASSKAIKLDPNCARAYFHRGCARVDLGQHDASNEDLGKAIELWPEDCVIPKKVIAFAHVKIKEALLRGCDAAQMLWVGKAQKQNVKEMLVLMNAPPPKEEKKKKKQH